MLSRLLIDHAARTVRLREPPPEPARGRGRRSHLTTHQVQRLRYDYWFGFATQPELAASHGLTKSEVSRIVNFKRLAWE